MVGINPFSAIAGRMRRECEDTLVVFGGYWGASERMGGVTCRKDIRFSMPMLLKFFFEGGVALCKRGRRIWHDDVVSRCT